MTSHIPTDQSSQPARCYSNRASEDMQVDVLTRLFALFPKPENPALTMSAYLEALADVPPLWVRRALYVLVMEDATRKWLPSISEIRGTAAEEIRKQWNKHNLHAVSHSREQKKISIGHWLAVCRGEAPEVRAHLTVAAPESVQGMLRDVAANPESELGF